MKSGTLGYVSACMDVAGESRSFCHCGLFSNIREQLGVQFIDIVVSKLVAVVTLRKEAPLCVFVAGWRLWLESPGPSRSVPVTPGPGGSVL